MNSENKIQTRNRKRAIQVNLNNSSEIQSKQRKYTISKPKMASENTNFRDLSGTINIRPTQTGNASVTATNTDQGPSTSVPNVAIDPDVRELVVDETLIVQRALEERVKKMVQEEMNEIRKSMGELTKVVKEISIRSRTQESVDSQLSNNIMDNELGNWNRTCVFPSENRFNFQNPSIGITNNSAFPQPIVNNINNLQRGNIPNIGNGAINADPIVDNRGTPGSRVASQNSNRNLERISIRVDKWGIVFDGNNTHLSVEDFIFRIEHLQAHYDISWEEILRDFHLLVTGPAKDWYWLLIRNHGVMKWPTLRCELLNQYRTNTSNFEIMRDLVERKQLPNESLEAFFHVMCKLRSRLVQPIPEYDMIKILKRNVRESVGRIIYPISVSSVEQLRIECLEAERNFPRRDMRNNMPNQRPIRSVNEVGFENIDETGMPLEEVAAFKVSQQKQPIVCWNCKVKGHGFRDCNSTERALFCYRCGKPNVIAPKCPDCQQGNRLQDVGMIGDPHPSKNPSMEN